MKWCRTPASSLAVLTSCGHFSSLRDEETASSTSHFSILYSHRQLKYFYLLLLSQLFPLPSSPEVSIPFILFLWLQYFSQTLQKSCWKHQESQPQLTDWTLTELPISPGVQRCRFTVAWLLSRYIPARVLLKTCTASLLRACPPSPAHMERVLSLRMALPPQPKAALPLSPLQKQEFHKLSW